MALSLLKSGWSSGNLIFEKRGSTATTGVHFGVDGTGIDVKFLGDTASSFALWDQSADELVFDAADLHMGDNDELRLGDLAAGDIVHTWTGSAYTTTAAVASSWNIGGASANINATLRGTLTVGADAAGNDTKIFSSTTGAYWLFDVSGDELICEGADIHLNDNDELRLGDAAAGDVVMKWDNTNFNTTFATTAGWNIGSASANTNITLRGTLTVGADAAGADTKIFSSTTGAYWLFDVSGDELICEGADIHLNDNDEVRFGDAATGDVVMKWDNSNFNTTFAASAGWNIGATAQNVNVALKGTLTVGADTEPYDTKFFGSTTGSYWLWDASADKMFIVGGTADLGTACECDSYSVGGTSGATFASGAVTNIEVINGLVVYCA